jgi:hypothetical protein
MDARFPERWLNDRRVVRLSDAGFRLLVTSLAWSVANRTDGRLDKDDLDLLHGVDARHVDELVTAGLMTETSAGSWSSTVYMDTQTSKAQLDGLEYKREQDRQRQANKRARDRGLVEPYPDESRDSPRDVTTDIDRDTKARLGQARQGKDAVTGEREERGREAEFFALSGPRPVARCSVCSGPLTSPLDVAEGVCAPCDNQAHREQAS